MGTFDPSAVARTYDMVAAEYAEKFGDDLAGLPFDRSLLDEVASRAGDRPVLDVGCGPGQAASHLASQGSRVVGLDLSPKALSTARTRAPRVGWAVTDMRALPLATGVCGGAVLFYSLHHLPRPDLPTAVAELRRALAPGGVVLIATHQGEGELASPTEWFGHQVEAMAATLFMPDELTGILGDGGFAVDAVRSREPLPHEYQGPRVYVTATAV